MTSLQSPSLPSALGWFAPPKFECPDLSRRARALWMMSWPFVGIVTLLLGVAVAVEPETLIRRVTTVSAVAALMLILHAISRSGRPILASWTLVIGLAAIVTQRAWITGGIGAPVAVFYALFIVIGGILLGPRGGLATAVACMAGAIVLTIGSAGGLLTTRPNAGSPVEALTFVTLAIGLAALIQMLVAPARTPMPRTASSEELQMLVHDMRSPLQVTLAHLEMLRLEIRDEHDHDVEAAIGGAKALSLMTNSFLDLSRIEAGRMPVRRVLSDLAAMAYAVVNALRIIQPSREMTIEIIGNPECHCDPELTRRILENLVSNAMKHTGSSVPVRITIIGTRRNVSIVVSDTGGGIARDRRPTLFDLFSASHIRSTFGHESSGLGLAFCRRASEAQGGSIRLEDAYPRGSRFIVELPR